MITKTEAIALFQTYNQGFSQRVDSAIRSAASAGLTSVQISYGNVTNAIAASVAVELAAAGWTVDNNTTTKIVTIS